MQNKINKIKGVKNKEGGFLELIVIIVIALVIMRYYGITITGVIHWFTNYFANVLK